MLFIKLKPRGIFFQGNFLPKQEEEKKIQEPHVENRTQGKVKKEEKMTKTEHPENEFCEGEEMAEMKNDAKRGKNNKKIRKVNSRRLQYLSNP